MSTISSGTTLTTALVQTGDTTGNLVIKTGASNTTAVTINTAGAIGVGSSPSYGSVGQYLQSAGNAAPATWATVASSQWVTSGANISYTTGNVGIGTASPSYLLDVQRSSYGVTGYFYTNDGTRNPRLVIYGSSSGTTLQHTFSTGADSLIFATGGAVGSGTEAMRIDASQNVGIGTSSPSYRIDARSDTPAFFGTSATDGTRYGYTSALPSNSGNCYVGWIPETVGTGGVNGDLGLVPRTSAGASIRFFTGSPSATERLRIASAGQIGIGGANYGTSGQVLTSNGSGSAPSWQNSAAPTFSSQFSFPATNTALNWAHGLGSRPRQFGMFAVCTSSINSIPVGTAIAMSSNDGDGGRQTTVYANATNVGFYGSQPIYRGFDGGNFTMSSANFNCYFWALL